MQHKLNTFLMLAVLAVGTAQQTQAWDGAGHALITRLAVEGLPEDFPSWVKDPQQVERLCYLCGEPDRWRGQKSLILDHINNPDHYLDVEDLKVFGLELATLPRFRNEFIEMLAVFRSQHPDAAPVDKDKDAAHTRTVPGLLPYAIEENRWKVSSSWSTLRAFEAYPDVVTAHELSAARNNVIQNMGILSHFVGDAHQPLHLSQHHHGWMGPNPQHYSTDKAFHSFVDGVVLDLDNLTFVTLHDQARPAHTFDPQDDWPQILAFLQQSESLVEPLYRLEKSGALIKEEGKTFIADRLLEGGADLAGLWVAAYKASAPDPYVMQQLDVRRTLAKEPVPAPALPEPP